MEVVGPFTRNLLRLVLPGGPIVLAAGLLLRPQVEAGALDSVSPLWFHGFFAVALLLAAGFHQRRLLAAILVVALAELCWFYFAKSPSGETRSWIFPMVAVLLPVNLGALTLVRERGRFGWSFRGTGVFAVILIQPVVVADFFSLFPQALPAILTESASWVPVSSRLSSPAAGAFLVACLVTAVQALRRGGNASDRGILWALAMAALTFGDPSLGSSTQGSRTVFLAVACLVLVVAVLESSYALAYHDELTGLPARRALNESLLGLAEPYAVAVVDVDHFKRFNDRHGHKVGDEVLARVASTLRRAPGGGRGFRYGGEEFVLLYPGKEPSEVAPYLEELRREVAGSGFTLRSQNRPRKKPRGPARVVSKPGRTLSVTVSVGLAGPTDRRNDPHQVLEAADKALYRAKKAGRNRVSR